MDTEIKEFRRLLREHNHFITKPRLRLFVILQNNPALTVHQLVNLLAHHDQATVYRNIKVFEELNIIDRLWLGWNSKLELSDRFRRHHHHLSCIQCGKTTDIDEDAPLEEHIARLSRAQNFAAVDHQLEIRGICRTCQSKA